MWQVFHAVHFVYLNPSKYMKHCYLSHGAKKCEFPIRSYRDTNGDNFCCLFSDIVLPFSRSQRMIVLSLEQETPYLPSGVIDTAFTEDLCPLRVNSLSPVVKSNKTQFVT